MQEKKRAMTAFDWGLCILLASVAVAVVYVALRPREARAETVPLTYTVRIVGMDTALWESGAPIAAGDAVYSENGTLALGSVVTLETRPHVKSAVKDGEIAHVEVPHRMDADVTVAARGTLVPGRGARVSEIRIAAGEVGTFRIGSYYAARATVVDVTLGGDTDDGTE